ncbi:hypothetical protein EP7_004570 [Isosphaeraceae bacterium EP7]
MFDRDRRCTAAWKALVLPLILITLASACSAPGDSASDLDSSRAAADAFLAEIRTGKVDAAWTSTTAEFKSMLGQEGLRQFVRSNPALREPATFVSVVPVTKNTLAMTECTYKPAKRTVSVKVLLAPETSSWKVERLIVE